MSNGLHEFDMNSLENFDGGLLNLVLRGQLGGVAADCRDRPMDKKARTVTLKFSIVPVLEMNGDCNRVHMEWECDHTIPKHRSTRYSLGVRSNNTFVFNENSLENVNQNTLDFRGDDE